MTCPLWKGQQGARQTTAEKTSASHMLRTHGFCLVPSKPETLASGEVSRGVGLRKSEPARPHPGSSQERQLFSPEPGHHHPATPKSCHGVPVLSCPGMEGGGDFHGEGRISRIKKPVCASKPCSPDMRTLQATHTAPVPPGDTAPGGGAEGSPQRA